MSALVVLITGPIIILLPLVLARLFKPLPAFFFHVAAIILSMTLAILIALFALLSDFCKLFLMLLVLLRELSLSFVLSLDSFFSLFLRLALFMLFILLLLCFVGWFHVPTRLCIRHIKLIRAAPVVSRVHCSRAFIFIPRRSTICVSVWIDRPNMWPITMHKVIVPAATSHTIGLLLWLIVRR